MNFYNEHKNYIIPILNLVTFAICMVFNALAGAGILNNIQTGAISDMAANSFVPAGWAFSIWGLIYFALAAYVLYTLLPWNRGNEIIVNKIGLLLPFNFLVNTIWIFLWQWQKLAVSVVFMLLILGSLIAIYLRVDINYDKNRNGRLNGGDEKVPMSRFTSIARYWLFQFPFSIYLGWICVATVANLAAAIVYDPTRVGPFVPSIGTASGWSAGMQTVAALIALAMLYRSRDSVHAGVAVWALFAIADKQKNDAVVHTAALVLASLLIVVAVVSALDLCVRVVRNEVCGESVSSERQPLSATTTTTNNTNVVSSATTNDENESKSAAAEQQPRRKHRSRSRGRANV